MLKGIGVALVTPFKEDFSVDFNGLDKLIDHVVGGGVNYLVIQGTTGESVTTTSKEKAELLAHIKDKNSGLPLVYGIGGNNTQAILQSIKETDLSGVAALLSVSPYYNKPSQEGIFQHFTRIAEASPIPVILYNVPGRTASNVTAETTLRLSEHKNIMGVKEASGDLVQCMEIARSMPNDFHLISGDDMLTNPILSIGGCGVISVLANGFPSIFHKSFSLFIEGQIKESQQEMDKLLEINPLMYEESNPVGIKEVLSQLGICGPQVRLPLIQASESLKKRIQGALGTIRA